MKTLSILGVVTAAFAALAAIILTGDLVYLLFPLLAVATGVVAIFRRDRLGLVAGISLIVIGLLGLFLVFGSVSFKGGGGLGNDAQTNTTGWAFGLAVGLLVPGVVAALRWEEVRPRWLSIVAGAAILGAWVLAFLFSETLGEIQEGMNYAIALLALAAGTPALMTLLAARRPEPRPVPP